MTAARWPFRTQKAEADASDSASPSSSLIPHPSSFFEWPAEFDKPGDTTLKTWLGRAVERGIIVCEGTGRKADPYRYFLLETEAKWREKMGPELYDLLHEQECKFGWKSLQEKKALDREYDMSSTGAAGGDDAI